ncbi:MAG: glycosyltransferase [Candidatus Margulisbacteria bacterium]|nr:glycosyltransferase [Candidatus Margulisiibacteriota bacterium]
MTKFEPKISIIVPVRNADRTLKTTFEYLLGIDYPRDKMEIIIADGGSNDKTVQITKDFQKKHSFIKLVEIPDCKSPGHARNAALKQVKGEYVLFTDGDCAPEKDWAYQIVEPFNKDKTIGGVGGEILTLKVEKDNFTESYCEQVRFLSPVGRCKAKDSGYMPTIKEWFPHEVNGGNDSPFFATANFAVSKVAIDKIGGEFWDEPTGEDVDFSLRIMKAGYVLFFKKEAVVKHMHRVDLKSFKKQWHGYGYGHPLLIEKHAKNFLEFCIQIGKGFYFNIPWSKKGIVHIGNYHLMYFCLKALLVDLIVYAVFSILNLNILFINLEFLKMLAIIFAVGTVLFTVLYYWPVLKLKPLSKFFFFAKIRRQTNQSFMQGALDGMEKFKAICVEPSW